MSLIVQLNVEKVMSEQGTRTEDIATQYHFSFSFLCEIKIIAA